MGIAAISVLWGFAEATFFFIIPDVWLSWIAMEDPRKGMRHCILALAGALLGGIVMVMLTVSYGVAMGDALTQVPGIDSVMVETVEQQIRDNGHTALFTGPIRGIPYKIYAVKSTGLNPLMFLLVSIPARLIRFSLVTYIFGLAGTRLLRGMSLKRKRIIHAALWSVFYCAYFALI